MEQEISSPKKQVNKTAIVALGLMGALFFLVGISILAASVKTTTETTAHEGILLDATGTSRIGRGFSNNTTLIIRASDGDRDEFEVKASLKSSEIRKIRSLARAHKGERILYHTRGDSAPKLVSAETLDGTTIVSPEHTLAADRFTGWSMTLSGAVLSAFTILALVLTSRKTQELDI